MYGALPADFKQINNRLDDFKRIWSRFNQSVERILGKDEVASSNLASSSKASEIFGFQRFSFVFHTFSEENLEIP